MITALVLGPAACWVGYLLHKYANRRDPKAPVERPRSGHHSGDAPMPTWARKPAAPAKADRRP